MDFFIGSTVSTPTTARYASLTASALQPGETVLITGRRRCRAGVRRVAHLIGGRVIAAVGSVAKAQAAGDEAEHVIDTSHETRERGRRRPTAKDRRDRQYRRALFLTLARLHAPERPVDPDGFVGGEIPSADIFLC